MDKKLEMLSKVPLFSHLDSAGLAQVGRLADEIDLDAGQTLLRQGANAHEFFLILDGTVDIERDGAAINVLGPGDFLGEIALLDGGVRSATAKATSPVRLLVLGRREFNTLMTKFPDVNAAVLAALAVRVRANEQVED